LTEITQRTIVQTTAADLFAQADELFAVLLQGDHGAGSLSLTIQKTSPGPLGLDTAFRATARVSGLSLGVELRCTEYVPPQRVTLQSTAEDAALPLRATLDFQPHQDGNTMVTAQLSYEPPAGLMGAMFEALVPPARIEKQMGDGLQRLCQHLEAADTATGKGEPVIAPPPGEAWRARVRRIHQATAHAELPCAEVCPEARCETEGDEGVLFLPYEHEVVSEYLGRDITEIESVHLMELSTLSLPVVYLDGESPCPFLTANLRCSIHDARPFDCRSYPVMPIFEANGRVLFYQAYPKDCPLGGKVSDDFRELMESLWREVNPHLPQEWKRFYNEET